MKFNSARSFVNGYAGVKMGGKWGFINRKGEIVVKCVYDKIKDFSEDVVAVEKSEVWGVVDNKGMHVLNFWFAFIGPCRNGIIRARDANDEFFFYNKQGDRQMAESFKYARDFSDGMAAVKENGLWGYINTDGEMIIKPWYQAAFDFQSGSARVKKSCKWGLINKQGEFVIDPIYRNIEGPYDVEDWQKQ